MRLAITGSIATDHLLTFPGRFVDQLLPDQLHRVSLSFLADGLEVRRGGVAANIAYGLATLGLTPVLLGAAGKDFEEYGRRLSAHGVDTSRVWISESLHTARFICTTDADQNQLATFYPGAMAEATSIDLSAADAAAAGFDLVVISPDAPEAMLQHTEKCRELGLPFAADPSQQLARLDGQQVRRLIDGARYLFTNSYEASLLMQRTGWTQQDVLGRVGTWLTTQGDAGVTVLRADVEPVSVPAVQTGSPMEPTGVGDAFRAGFLAGVAWGWSEVRAVHLGCSLATAALETIGTQEYHPSVPGIVARMEEAYPTEPSFVSHGMGDS